LSQGGGRENTRLLFDAYKATIVRIGNIDVLSKFIWEICIYLGKFGTTQKSSLGMELLFWIKLIHRKDNIVYKTD
uniref:hypothetical protein n=1 Tax=uncultured Allobaculum sp. TaxID=1187017 RepID=UPI0025866AD1